MLAKRDQLSSRNRLRLIQYPKEGVEREDERSTLPP